MKSIVFIGVLLAGCVPATPPATIETATFAASLNVDLSASTKLPTGLYLRDLTPGTGAEALAGSKVTMRYTGWFTNGTQFDSNQTNGFQFRLGAGEVIAGWDQGVGGMKVGGTRQLIIPPSLGYGATGQGPIPGDSILVFSVTMVSTP